jgi:Bacterial capsule synthesis protein PGA_cap
MLDAGASVVVGHHPHVLQSMETYHTQDGRTTLIFYSLGNFLSNQSRSYVDGLNPDPEGDPRDEMIGLFSAVRKDYGPAGIRVEVGHVGMIPLWEENNRNEIAAGRTKTPVIRPILIDREIPKLQARLDELNKLATPNQAEPNGAPVNGNAASANAPASALTADQKKEFIEVTDRLKLLTDRRAQILARVGDEYVEAPPPLSGRP